MTRAELPVLAAQLVAERLRLGEVAREIELLRELLEGRGPSRIELAAAAAFLHTLYTGMENCLERLARGIDESVPAGSDSHRALLDQLSAPIPGLRPALFERELAARMDELRRFRHAFRHMYFVDLDWPRVRPLLEQAPRLLADVEAAIDRLLSRVGPG